MDRLPSAWSVVNNFELKSFFTIVTSGWLVFNDIELTLNGVAFQRIKNVISLKKTENENSAFSAELCIWKTRNASAMQTYKKKGFNSRDRVDRVKVTANIYFHVNIL